MIFNTLSPKEGGHLQRKSFCFRKLNTHRTHNTSGKFHNYFPLCYNVQGIKKISQYIKILHCVIVDDSHNFSLTELQGRWQPFCHVF